jgi:hypothetical protein
MRAVRPDPGALTVFLWFLGGALVIVWNVFHDPRFDYRLVLLGALLPDIVDAPLGGARAMHSVTANVALLFVVMLATIGRRPLRRRVLALPIGSLLHLVLDGAFTNPGLFWWPIGGGWPHERLPSMARSGALDLLLELIGFGQLLWAWRRFGLTVDAARRRFLRTGSLEPVASPTRRTI